MLQDADIICGHNIINFDIPAIQKLFPGFKKTWDQVLDTLVWARVTWPNIKDGDFARVQRGRLPGNLIGSHSLEAYGFRLGVNKDIFGKTTDWQRWSPKMSDYCEQDVRVNVALFEKLKDQKTSSECLRLEHQTAWIISRQERHGVPFDYNKATQLYCELLAKREDLLTKIQESFPPFYKQKGKLFTPKRDLKKRGDEWVGYVAGAEMQKVELVDFNPGSSDHISRWLIRKYHWHPTEFTEKEAPSAELCYYMEAAGIDVKTTPKVNDEILKALPYEEAPLLAEFQMIQKRLGQLAEGKHAWLKHYNEKTGRIYGAVNTNGAVTGRMTHFNPNLAQVPASYSPYGLEMRSLFHVLPGRRMVGVDADGLEARCLAHFMAKYDDGAYIKVILEGKKSEGTDVHSLNAKALGCSRDTAKVFFYAFLYGGGDLKLGSILIIDPAYADVHPSKAGDLGKKMKAKFLKAFPALEALTKAVQAAVKTRGWLRGLDGRKLPSRSPHSALNLLLQSAGALVMKKALCLADERMTEAELDYEFLLNVHDEFQMDVAEEHAEQVAAICEQSIADAGEYFNFRCPLSGSADIGFNWAETH